MNVTGMDLRMWPGGCDRRHCERHAAHRPATTAAAAPATTPGRTAGGSSVDYHRAHADALAGVAGAQGAERVRALR